VSLCLESPILCQALALSVGSILPSLSHVHISFLQRRMDRQTDYSVGIGEPEGDAIR
jgi:hypothetical protein